MWLISKIYDFENVGFFTAMKKDDGECLVAQITRRSKIVLLDGLYFDIYTPEGEVRKHINYTELLSYNPFGVIEDEYYKISM